jgi:hypothetical protein
MDTTADNDSTETLNCVPQEEFSNVDNPPTLSINTIKSETDGMHKHRQQRQTKNKRKNKN